MTILKISRIHFGESTRSKTQRIDVTPVIILEFITLVSLVDFFRRAISLVKRRDLSKKIAEYSSFQSMYFKYWKNNGI